VSFKSTVVSHISGPICLNTGAAALAPGATEGQGDEDAEGEEDEDAAGEEDGDAAGHTGEVEALTRMARSRREFWLERDCTALRWMA